MKKIDFAIHLLSAARTALDTDTRHIRTVALLALLELSRRGGVDWHSSTSIAAALNITTPFLSSTVRKDISLGLLEKRKGKRLPGTGGIDPLDYRITAKGQCIVAKLLDTSALTSPTQPVAV